MMIHILIALMLMTIASPASTNPSWSLTNAVKTGTYTLFSTLTPVGTTAYYSPNYPSFFTGSTSPYLAYGIQKYKGSDYLLFESFIMTLTSVDFMGFTIKLQITGVTNPLLMAISFMAVDANNFPYFFNVFTEVPLNYGSSLTNFSVASSSLLSHTQVVNYTDQNANFGTQWPTSSYSAFSAPYSQYRIALFMTSMDVVAKPLVTFTFDVTCTVLSTDTYQMYATLGYNSTISILKFTQVFFDTSQFSTTSGKYLYFQELPVTNTAVTTFFQFNSALANNFMMGLKSFSSTSGQCLVDYQWVLTSVSGNYGSQIQTSSSSPCGVSGDVSTILLMMKWTCPGGYPYFDLTTRMCLTSCNPYTYLNATDNTCYPCVNTVCYTCNAANSNICLTCATNLVVVNNTCICDTSQGYYLDINGQCYKCANLQPYCTMCTYAGNISVAYNAADFTCLTCDASQGYFIDPNNVCQLCSISHCTTCLGYSFCSVCSAGYGVTVAGTCSTCPISGCQTCSSLTVCSVCATGYMKVGNLCYTCPISCTCGGYTLPRYANGDCSAICGDGIIIFPYEGCDDGNTDNGDGCSSSCQIQSLSTCSGQPSLCYYTSTITGALINSEVSPSTCNVITFSFKLTPYLSLQANPNISWFTAIATQNASILYSQLASSYSNGLITLTYAYSQNLQGLNVTFKVIPQNMLSPTYLNYTTALTFTVPVVPTNNLPAVYMNSQVCSKVDSTQKFLQAEAGISYFGLLLSIFSCKIIGLEMFGVLQLSYFSLSNYDYVPPALMGLLQRKEVNGLNIQGSSESNSSLPSRVTSNGINSSDYLSNINIMLLVTCIIAVTGLAMYMVTYLINKDSIDEEKLSEALKSVDGENSSREAKEEQPRSQFLHRISKYILKEVLLTFVIFNMFNISYSAGIQIKYINTVSSFSIICLLLTFTLIIVIAGAQLVTDKKQFGEYIDKFKKERLQSKYMIATIIYRFILGFLLAMINEWIASGIVFTFISGAFLTYICYTEPFIDQFQNIRSKFIHSVHVLILFINFYYRMEANNNVAESSQLSVPAYIQITAVSVSVIGSTILLAYEVIKKYILKKGEKADPAPQAEEAKNDEIKREDTKVVLQEFS